jgi:hypothetical protein
VLRGTSERASARGARWLTIAAAVLMLVPASARAGAQDVAIVSGPPAWTNESSASFGLSSDEPGGIECRLDFGGDWERCEDGHTLSGLQEGRHVLEARMGGGAVQDSWSWGVDVTAPTVPRVFEPTGRWHSERYVTASWGATDSPSGIGSYDVRYDVWTATGGAATGVRWLEKSTVTGAAFHARAGHTYCLRVAVEDRAGNRAPSISPDRCFARPLDDAVLELRGGWARRTGATGYQQGSYVETSRLGAFARTTVSAKRLLLVATRCPVCGSVVVRWRGQVVRTVHLRVPRTTKSARIPLVSLPALERGTLRLDVVSSGRRVRIDGVGASAA